MPAKPYDYASVRLVPCLDRGECINVGVLIHSPAFRFLGIRLELDEDRTRACFPALPLADVRKHLAAWQRICAGDRTAGPIAEMGVGERFAWLTTPRNTMLQTSPVHGGVTEDPAATLEALFARLVRTPAI